MAYTLELESAASTFTFQVQPTFEPDYSFEYDNSKTPPTLSAIIETWALLGATFSSSTEADITDHLEDLLDLVSSRTQPVHTVRFKRASTTVYSMSSSSSHRSVSVARITPRVVPGTWATHLSYDIVVVGRRDTADGDGIVRLEQTLSYAYDAAGLLTLTLRGKVQTLAAGAEEVARGLALESPGAAYGLMTGGEDAVNVSVLDYPDDRVAEFESVWREHGVSLPAGVEEYSLASETHRTPRGTVTNIHVRARGGENASSTAAVRTNLPSSGLTQRVEGADTTGLGASGTYVSAAPSEDTVSLYGHSTVVGLEWKLSVSRAGSGVRLVPVPGGAPVLLRTPSEGDRVEESVIVSSIDINGNVPIPPPLYPDYIVPSAGSDSGPFIAEYGLDPAGHTWRREVRRVYAIPFAEDDPEDRVRAVLASGGNPQWQ